VKTCIARDTLAPHTNADGRFALERVTPPL
jgi:hypothetical protein